MRYRWMAGILGVVAVGVLASGAFGDVFSVDRDSVQALSHGVSQADILAPGPVQDVLSVSLGLDPGFDDLDALSDGTDDITGTPVLFFSVDRESVGVGAGAFVPYVSEVYIESQAGQAAGDVFATCWGHPGIPVWSAPVGQNMLHINQQELGLAPLIFPTMPDPGQAIDDDLDALNFSEFDVTGDKVIDRAVYFSLDAASPSLAGPASADDILMLAPGAGAVSIFADGIATMGLQQGDDIDALVLLDLVNPGQLDPGQDIALYSLAPGSPTLVANGLSAADILGTNFAGGSSLVYTHDQLGLLAGDNVDALEVQPGAVVPEPGTMFLLGTGLIGLLGVWGRKRMN